MRCSILWPSGSGAAASALLAVLLSSGDEVHGAPNWTLSTSHFDRSTFANQPYVANGYIGQRLPVEGVGYSEIVPVNRTGQEGTNGWPLFDSRFTAAMVAGFYDQQSNTSGTNFAQTGGQQPISTLPTWSTLTLTINNASYGVNTPSSEISNWNQSLSLQNGVVKTSLEWTPSSGNSSVNLRYTVYAHRTLPNLGVVRLDVSGLSQDMDISVTDLLDGAGSWRTSFVESGILTNYSNTIYTAVRPNGISNVTAYEVSVATIYPFSSAVTTSPVCGGFTLSRNDSTISQCYTIATPVSGEISVIKFVGIASSDAYPGAEMHTALHAARHGNFTGWVDLLADHTNAWDDIWDSADILIPGEEHEDLQLTTRASLFHLLSNIRNGSEASGLGDNSIAPAGLTSDSYAGQIFWDAETWMYPSLLALQPAYAESIVDFRYRQLGAALQNAKQYNSSGALYPWTAGRFGNCTGAGPCYDYEYHINNDISQSVYQYYAATQNKTWLEQIGWPIISSVASFWEHHVVYNASTGLYGNLNMTDPDEYANFKDNGAFTNAGVSVVLRNALELGQVIGRNVSEAWAEIAAKMTVLEDSKSSITLEYDGFNGTTDVKQADVVLLTYPLEYPQSKTQGLLNLDFYALATSPNGPGMTYSVFSIDASELSPVGCASWTYLLASSQPYARAPYYQFSEQTTDDYATNGGTNPAFTFLTGHGGFLQVLTHGFTGYRSRLRGLYLDPTLPPQLKNYTIKGMKWGDSSFDLDIMTKETTLRRRSGTSHTVNVEIASANTKSGNYSLMVGESLTVPTRIANGTLVNGNLAQCTRVLSTDTVFLTNSTDTPVVPGQYALAAIDGSNSTSWQPSSNTSATMTVDLGSTKNISGFHFNWGSVPPRSYTVFVGQNVSTMTLATGAGAQSVTISSPYDANTANVVAPSLGNLTDYQLLPGTSMMARYVNLTIEGSWSDDGMGGTVAEFAVL